MEYKVLATVLVNRQNACKDYIGKCCWLMENKPRWKGDWYKWEFEQKNTSNKFRLDALLKGPHDIYCVKRLTDNVEFMIGDLINTYGKIEKIKIDSNGLFRAIFSRNRGVWRLLDEIPKNFHKDHQIINNVEPQYQILAFRNNESEGPRMYTKLLQDGTYSCTSDKGASLEWCLKQNYTIHSVKRLSDGEIFTINDNINAQTIKNNQKCVISKFRIAKTNKGDELKVIYTDKNHNDWENTIDKIETCSNDYQKQMRMYNQAISEMNKHMEAEMDRIEAEFWFGKSLNHKLLLLTKRRRNG